MMVSPLEIVRRSSGRLDGRVRTLPILALEVHSACNCRCVMCDIWKANHVRREIDDETLAAHAEAIRRLHVRRVMLTGGEPLLHRNLWRLCDRLLRMDIAVTLVTTGILLEAHAAAIGLRVDTVVVSLDGPRAVHDDIRRVPGGFDRIARGLAALLALPQRPRLVARSVVQRANFEQLAETIDAAWDLGFDEVSFLGADVTSHAFNRPEAWSAARQAEVAVPAERLPALDAAIERVSARQALRLEQGFVAGGLASLARIRAYYAALAGQRPFPAVRCNAPWVSAVLEANGAVRPCFFHEPYAPASGLDATINGASAVAFRRALDPRTHPTCQRCVCWLDLPVTRRP
ncbi:MAG: radical SAM protein [Acidobacteriota bacterium]